MIRALIAMLGGCGHFNLSFPQTDRRTRSTTQVCLSCGKSWIYDWSAMRQGAEVKPLPQPTTQCPTLDMPTQENPCQ